ncbi:hypothetical protein [Kushneria aurantia]|uniref:Uncharacterized protein n=1 Tax=Kushneria aurantia TaxID=504092 RepID=A0ABV6G8F5_9GAMM|nr:hypothetical protein [Kushneria aurantia]
MPIEYRKRSAVMQGVCQLEEVEELQGWMLENPRASLNLGQCEHLHTAIVQLILASEFRISTPPERPLLKMALGLPTP